jgi:amino-acid N-acetyltransferase
MIIQKPTLQDIKAIQTLLSPFVKEGIILKRDDDEVASNIRSYHIVKENGRVIGVGALHIYSAELGEIRSLVVEKEYQGKGVGRAIIKEIEREAKQLKLNKLLTLTYQKEFFEKLGFVEIPKESVPSHKVWSDCIKCPHFPNCNEISLIKTI